MILRLSLVFILFYCNLIAITVLIAKKPINFEEKIEISKLKLKNVSYIIKSCKPLKFNQVKNQEYLSTHYINKGSIICLKDVKKYLDNSVLFNFGSLQIEKKGKIIYENEEFIRIKKLDGKIEKIYKDGRLK